MIKNIKENGKTIYTRELDDEQLEVVELDESMLVRAIAGAGKTTIAENKILKLLNNGINGEGIICLAFNKSITEDNRKRIRALSNKFNEANKIIIKTVDAFLRKYVAEPLGLTEDNNPDYIGKLTKKANENRDKFEKILKNIAKNLKIKWLILDEVQDLSDVEERDALFLMMPFIEESEKILVLGDPDQRLYPSCQGKIFQQFKNIRNIDLTRCYRCSENIVDLASKIIGRKMTAVKDTQCKIEFHSSCYRADDFTDDNIIKLILKNSREYKDTAVLEYVSGNFSYGKIKEGSVKLKNKLSQYIAVYDHNKQYGMNITSVRKYKGKEADCIILLFFNPEWSGSNEYLTYESMNKLQDELKILGFSEKAINNKILSLQDSIAKRLLYVGITRARKKLIIISTAKCPESYRSYFTESNISFINTIDWTPSLSTYNNVSLVTSASILARHLTDLTPLVNIKPLYQGDQKYLLSTWSTETTYKKIFTGEIFHSKIFYSLKPNYKLPYIAHSDAFTYKNPDSSLYSTIKSHDIFDPLNRLPPDLLLHLYLEYNNCYRIIDPSNLNASYNNSLIYFFPLKTFYTLQCFYTKHHTERPYFTLAAIKFLSIHPTAEWIFNDWNNGDAFKLYNKLHHPISDISFITHILTFFNKNFDVSSLSIEPLLIDSSPPVSISCSSLSDSSSLSRAQCLVYGRPDIVFKDAIIELKSSFNPSHPHYHWYLHQSAIYSLLSPLPVYVYSFLTDTLYNISISPNNKKFYYQHLYDARIINVNTCKND